MDYDDSDYTNVDDQLGSSSPRNTPRMRAAETLMPTMSYRAPASAAVGHRTPPVGAALGRIALVRAPARVIGFKR